MATGNDNLLQRLRKLLAEAADTSDLREPWQELFGRQDSVPPRAVRAAEAVKGFAGSWAASYSIDQSTTPASKSTSAPRTGFDSLLGKRGYPEINFVPYNWNTNAQGLNGPSMVGHPVSFEFVGPTQKKKGAVSFGADLSDNRVVCSEPWTNVFGLDVDEVVRTPHWVMITDPGDGMVDPITGDKAHPPTVDDGLVEKIKYAGTARYELFRIDRITQNEIYLDSGKALSEYFERKDSPQLVGNLGCVAILKPKVARLAVLDNSCRNFAVVPPMRSALGEYNENAERWALAQGKAEDYNLGYALPIPKPIPLQAFVGQSTADIEAEGNWFGYTGRGQGVFKGRLSNLTTFDLGVPPYGRFRVAVDEAVYTLVKERKNRGEDLGVLHIQGVVPAESRNNPISEPDTEAMRHYSVLLGYHEIVDHDVAGNGENYLECRLPFAANPATGTMQPFAYGWTVPGVPGGFVDVECTLHNTIRSLFSDVHPYQTTSYDDIEAARLTGLIDPKEVGRSLKVHSTNDVPLGGYSGRADRAIPNTRTFDDPGSLLDLGFRMVLFTAKTASNMGGVHAVNSNTAQAQIVDGAYEVDWNKPLPFNELVLDPSITDEKQYVDVDYASGTVSFSHRPAHGGDLVLNSDGQPIVFAAFVAYSMEGGQRGNGIRVTGGDLNSANLGYPDPTQHDVFSSRSIIRTATEDQTLNNGNNLRLLFEPDKYSYLVPNNGYFNSLEVEGQTPFFDTQQPNFAPFTYDGWSLITDPVSGETLGIELQNVRWDAVALGFAITFPAASAITFRHRPDIKYRFDTTYGSSVRADSIRFAYADLSYGHDGSVTVMPTAVAGPAQELRAFFPLGERNRQSELARFHFDELTQRWTTNDAPWMNSGHSEPPKKSHEIGIEVSRGRLYTNWEFAPESGADYSVVHAEVSAINYDLDAGFTLPDGFNITVRDLQSGANDAVYNCFNGPNIARASLLTAVIEGATIASKAFGSKAAEVVPQATRSRFVIANKNYTDRSEGFEDCPANPNDWVAVPVSNGADIVDIVDEFNAKWAHMTGSGESFAYVTPENEIGFYGRQIQALPSFPYLPSDQYAFPITVPAGTYTTTLDLRSAWQGRNAKMRMRPAHLYTNLELNVFADVSFATTVEFAHWLNLQVLYSNQTLSQLENAGFLQTDRNSENPSLLAAGIKEHQLVFVAKDDPRYPANIGENHVVLLCGGAGMAEVSTTDRTEDYPKTEKTFYYAPSVWVELDAHLSNDSLLNLLGLSVKLTHRIGLFLGEYSIDQHGSDGRPYAESSTYGTWDNYLLGASGNAEFLRFHTYGTRPLGRFVGSFEIDNVNVGTNNGVANALEFKVLFPKGQSSDWYNDQSAIASLSDAYLDKLNPKLHDYSLSSEFQSAHIEAGWRRGAWPHYNPQEFVYNQGSGGIKTVHMSFGTKTFNESHFKTALSNDGQHGPQLVEIEPTNYSEWKRPNHIWDDLAYGDIVSAYEPFALQPIIEGRVINKTPSVELDEFGFPNDGRYSIFALVNERVMKSSQKRLVQGFSKGSNPLTGIKTSLTPSPVWGHHAAVSHAVSHGGQTNYNRGLEGQFTDQPNPNAMSSVLVGAGRVSMTSALGAIEPTGISFHNILQAPTASDSHTAASLGRSSVYLESGAWTTTYPNGDERVPYWGDKGMMPGTRGSKGNPYTNKSAEYGGVGGIRISGDAHLWLNDIQELSSDEPTAFLLRSHPSQTVSGLGYEGGHTTGISTSIPNRNRYTVEMTVLIGLSQSDLAAFEGFINTDSAYTLGSSVLAMMGLDTPFWSYNPGMSGQGGRYFDLGQAAIASDTPQFMPSLAGSYIAIGGEGLFKVIAAPVIQLGGALAAMVRPDIGLFGYSSGTPLAADIPSDSDVNGKRTVLSKGRNRESQFVGFVALRVEASSTDPNPPPLEDGQAWRFFDDTNGDRIIYTAKVVDPGGSPTGAPASIRGLTIDPQVVAGKSRLPIQLVQDKQYGISTVDSVHLAGFNAVQNQLSTRAFPLNAELIGVHDQIGRYGKHFSRAFFTSWSDLNVGSSARMVILAEEAGLVDGLPSIDDSDLSPQGGGRINTYGYQRRLGPGVMMDGGLGLVQATAFRATPRSQQTESLGQLTVWGRGAYPFYNGLRPADVGVELPSTFNTSEFHGEVSIANPQGRLVFESPWAAEGLVANMFTAQYASKNYIGPYHYTLKGIQPLDNNQVLTSLFMESGLGMSDTLFPYVSAGVVVRSTGTTVYERAFRSIDATGSNPHRKMREGSHNRSGIPGMGVPFKGEVLLLPQGPTTKGQGYADFRGNGQGKTPLDIPLYEFLNGATVPQAVKDNNGDNVLVPYTKIESSPFGINVAGVVDGISNATRVNALKGPLHHKGQMGTVSQAYRHSNSRQSRFDFEWDADNGGNPQLQVRVLDGMVLEDTTNGTFYTIGSIGRDVRRENATTQLGFIGDGVRSPVNGSLTASGTQETQGFGPGGLYSWNEISVPEILFDFKDGFNPETDPFIDPDSGFGDRTDNGRVRRPLFGHNMRVTPNVEFVPVLGPRGVRGGLLPPWVWVDTKTGPKRVHVRADGIDADAIFYDLDHPFKADDVGKMIYVCGTHTYEHTGWWVIIGFDEGSNNHYAHGVQSNFQLSNYVMLRKYNWTDRDVPTTHDGFNNDYYVPLGDTSRSLDASGAIPLRIRAPYVTLVADKRTNLADGLGFMGTAFDGEPIPKEELNCSDFKLGFIPASGLNDAYVAKFTRQDLIDQGIATLQGLANMLNAKHESNGQAFLASLIPGTIPNDFSQLVKWEVIENVLYGRYVLTSLSGNLVKTVLGEQAAFTVYWESRKGISGSPVINPTDDDKAGFISCVGHSLNADRTTGDRNNAMPIPALRDDSDGTSQYEFDYKDTAARGLRWVFSHPLSEENVGSYVHLTKPHKYHFGGVLPAQSSPEIEANDLKTISASWSTANFTKKDEQSLKGLFLTTDIFRINRCPNTGKLILGGDCEVYFTECHSTQVAANDMGKGQGVMYSPLGVYGNWQDTDTGELNNALVNWPTLYELQPIAREKIVVVSPSSARSVPIFTRGRSDKNAIPVGPQGVGPMVVAGNPQPHEPESSFLMEPWQLVSRANVSKTAIATTHLKEGEYDSRVEANNANVKEAPIDDLLTAVEEGIAKLDAKLGELGATIGDEKAVLEKQDFVLANDEANLAQTGLGIETSETVIADWLFNHPHVGEKIAFLDDIEIKSFRGQEYLVNLEKTLAAKTTELVNIQKSKVNAAEEKEINEKKKAATVSESDAITTQIQALDENISSLEKQTAQNAAEFVERANAIAKLMAAAQAIDENVDFEADWYTDDAVLAEIISDVKTNSATIEEIRALIEENQAKVLSMTGERDELVAQKAPLTELEGAYTAAIEELTGFIDALDAQIALYEFMLTENPQHVSLVENVGWQSFFEAAVFATWLDKAAQNDPIGLRSLYEATKDLYTNMQITLKEKTAEFMDDPEYQMHLKLQNALGQLQSAYDDQLAALKVTRSQRAAQGYRVEELEEENSITQQRKQELVKERDDLNTRLAMAMGNQVSDPKLEVESTYVWSPAGEWWQLYQPAWDQYGPDASSPPPTLKIDLTESFTQAVGPGSGLNSPFPGRFPRGVRLNRIWVNFGSWGTPPNVKGTRLGQDTPGYSLDDENFQDPGDVLNELYITFNLILEIPGSQARVMGNDAGVRHPQNSGTAGFPFGDRAPTSSFNHKNNADYDGEINAWPGGTIVVPLYVNREAGDLMPNVMERFVTVGPEPSYNSIEEGRSDPQIPDWSGGHYEHGFGAGGASRDPNLYNMIGVNQSLRRVHWDGSTLQHYHKQMMCNAYNPVVWGGMDFSNKSHSIEGGTRKGVFEKSKFARVQASVFPRQSIVGGGLRSCFTSGLVPDGKVFAVHEPQSLSAATLTGITIAHSAQYLAPPEVQAGSYTSINKPGGHSCPHAFTVALTPVGDEFKPYPDPLDPSVHVEARYGRNLETKTAQSGQYENNRHFKVGNWLDRIKSKYGIAAPSGSMLPPGSRVFLEVAVGPGPAAKNQDPEDYCAAGTWVGNVKLSFDVETVDGTAWTTDVNTLGDEEG